MIQFWRLKYIRYFIYIIKHINKNKIGDGRLLSMPTSVIWGMGMLVPQINY